MRRGVPFSSTIAMWDHSVSRFPNKPAVIEGDTEWSFSQADAIIRALAAGMQERFGIVPGDRIALLMPNSAPYFFAYWAANVLGAVVVPVNHRLHPDEMRHVIGGTQAKVLVVAGQYRKVAAEATASGCEQLAGMVTVGFEQEGEPTFEELAGSGKTIATADIDPEALAIVMHTSGTTGVPKGAVMHQDDLWFNILCTMIAQGCAHQDRHILVVPMFHATALYSLLPTSAYLGSTMVVEPSTSPREILRTIERHRCTTFFGVPTLFQQVLCIKDLDTFDLSSLRLIAYAGSTMPPATIKALAQAFPGVSLHNFFGMTETISMTHVLPADVAVERADSIGIALPEIGQKIADDDGQPLAAGQVGELCFRQENVVRAYWNQPDRMAQSIRDGWFHTGDLAMVDEDGYVYLRGRRKDMIISCGENVYAQEVEQVVLALEGVADAAVVGIPATGSRAAMGELVKAVVVCQDGADLKVNDVRRHCAGLLASYKVPTVVEFRGALPRTPTGKVIKRDLQ